MPFISELKVLGTLNVQELKNIFTVYLIHLEGSTETNFVYCSHSSITSPPAHLTFTCPDGHTKPGDVLLWASVKVPKGRGSSGRIHRCWVFDGTEWVKRPDLHSSVNRMQHPEHSDYLLVVSSGPFVKWELRPGPDQCDSDESKPSSTPDPPAILARLGAKKAVKSNPTVNKELRRTTSQSEAGENGSR